MDELKPRRIVLHGKSKHKLEAWRGGKAVAKANVGYCAVFISFICMNEFH